MLPQNNKAQGAGLPAGRLGSAGIAVTAVALLGVSAGSAWLLHSGVGQATAQSGAVLAAKEPEYAGRPSSQPSLHPPGATFPLRIEQIVIEADRPARIEGTAPALAAISLLSSGRQIGQTVATTEGAWRLSIERGLEPGDHRLQARAMPIRGAAPMFTDSIRVSTPRILGGPVVISLAASGAADMAAAADASASAGRRESAERRLVQATGQTVTDAGPGTLREWLERSDRSYNDIVVKRLSKSGGEAASAVGTGPSTVVAQAQPAPAPSKAPRAAEPSMFDGVFDWLKRSNDTYQKSIVKRLAEPEATLENLEAKAKAEEAKKAAESKTGDDVQKQGREDLRAAQAKRDAELKALEAAIKPADPAAAKVAPVAPKAIDDVAAAKAAEDKRIADETMKRQADLRAAEEKRAADAKQAAEEAGAAAAKKAAEDKRLADEAAKRSAEQKAADAKKAADEAATAVARKVVEEKRLAQEAAQRAAAEAKRAADMAREAEAKRQADLKAAADAKLSNDRAAAQQAEAKRMASQKAGDEAKRKAADLAEAASREASSRIAVQPSAPGRTVLPPLPSVSTGRPAVAKAAPERVVRATPPTRPRAPIDISTRSSLGAGSGVAALHRKPGKVQSQAKASCGKAGKRIEPPGYYVVKAGDSLWDIADLHYNDGGRFEVIERANRKLGDPDLIKPCQKIFVPAAKRG